jgi:PAS domain S-box-containing protein
MSKDPLNDEVLLASIVRSMAKGVIVWTANGVLLACNNAAERILGIPRSALEGRPFNELGCEVVYENGAPSSSGPFGQRGAQQRVTVGVRRPGGTLVWISHTSTVLPRPGEAGDFVIVDTFSDVTELRRAKDYFTEAMAGANVGTWELDHVTGHVERNERWAATLGYSLADIEPTIDGFATRIHPDDRAQWEAAVQAARNHSTPWVLECRVRHRDGRWVWVQTRGKVIERDATGAVQRTAGVLVDIDTRKRTEEALQASLTENQRLVGELKGTLERVKQLEGFLPICMYCKSIRNDAGYWAQLEDYIASRTGSVFSHGICTSCYTARFGDDDGMEPKT